MGLAEYLFGHEAEKTAAKFLSKNGYKILNLNYKTKFGEIDIIAMRDSTLHFIEVKASTKDYQTIYRVTQSKLEKIIKAIDFYMLNSNLNLPYQIDIICINNQNIELIENITY
ncbi:YraN family protein [uncultured Campylobacter sp.]|uniref:YraN family protein n=1 Tax=uncultured Campylobacter sp. TaxID=218934 RepID=UPI00262E115F|nr:YraN family protein [uncultured Campylobacter sp.]